MRVRITLGIANLIIVSAIGFVPIAYASPVREPTAMPAKLKAPKPPKGCPYAVHHWFFRDWVGDLKAARGDMATVERVYGVYSKIRYRAWAKPGYRLCKTVIQYGRNQQYVTRARKVDKVIKHVYDDYSGKELGPTGFYIFAKKR